MMPIEHSARALLRTYHNAPSAALPNVIVFALPAGSTELMINKHVTLSLLTITLHAARLSRCIYIPNIGTSVAAISAVTEIR